MRNADSSAGQWWDWHLFGLWVLVNAAAFAVIPLAGTLIEQLASSATKNLVHHHHKVLAIVIIAVAGAGVQGTLWGRWQWRLLVRRVPELPRRRWVIATTVPAFVVWVLVLAPAIADTLAQGGSTLVAFRNGFVQALVLGPLIGVSQAMALRPLTSRWAWWFLANVTTYLSGTLLRQLGVWLRHELSLPARVPIYFPVVAFAIHGAWMLWVTAPQTVSSQRPPQPATGTVNTGTTTPGTSAGVHRSPHPREPAPRSSGHTRTNSPPPHADR